MHAVLPHLPSRIILASQSPRRQQMLTEAGFLFEVITHQTDESYPPNLLPPHIAQHIAYQKALAVAPYLQTNDDLIISADTIVCINNQLLGKPESEEEATRFLQILSGREHEVITGVCLMNRLTHRVFHATTKVAFFNFSAQQISYYVHHFKPYDKAGGYAIQEWIGLTGLQYINGCYFNVVGLPMSRLINELHTFLPSK